MSDVKVALTGWFRGLGGVVGRYHPAIKIKRESAAMTKEQGFNNTDDFLYELARRKRRGRVPYLIIGSMPGLTFLFLAIYFTWFI